jgi:hypothetical protein
MYKSNSKSHARSLSEVLYGQPRDGKPAQPRRRISLFDETCASLELTMHVGAAAMSTIPLLNLTEENCHKSLFDPSQAFWLICIRFLAGLAVLRWMCRTRGNLDRPVCRLRFPCILPPTTDLIQYALQFCSSLMPSWYAEMAYGSSLFLSRVPTE